MPAWFGVNIAKSAEKSDMKKLLVAGIAVIALASCTSTKPAVNNPDVKKQTPVDINAAVANAAFFNNVNKKPVFSELKINSKIDVQMGSFVPTADALIYIENGSKIWMNISAAFFQIARAIATPQGIKGYEKIGKTYIDSDFSYLNKMMNVDFLDYNGLQNMFLGKSVRPVNPTDFTLTQNAQGYTLTSLKNQKVSVEGKTSEYKIVLNYSPDFDLSRVVMQDTASADNVEIQYTNYILAGTNRLPKNVKIILKGKKTGQILIENTKFDFSKMETPYSVPANYTKKEFR